MNFNILGIGLPQIAIVLVLSLVLFGPKQMLQYAYQAGRFLAKARAMWEEAARSMQQEMQNSGVDLQEFRDLGQGLQQDWNKAVNGTLNDINGVGTTVNAANGSVPPIPAVSTPVVVPEVQPNPQVIENIPLAPPTSATTPSLDLSDVMRPESPASDDSDQTSDQTKKYDAWLLN